MEHEVAEAGELVRTVKERVLPLSGGFKNLVGVETLGKEVDANFGDYLELLIEGVVDEAVFDYE